MGGFQWVFLMFFSGPCKLPSFFTPLKNYNYIWKIFMFNRKYIGSNGGFSIVMLVLLLYFGQSNAAGGLETMEICKCKKPSWPCRASYSYVGVPENYQPLPQRLREWCTNETICTSSPMKDSLLQRKLDRFPKLAFFTGPLTQLLRSVWNHAVTCLVFWKALAHL